MNRTIILKSFVVLLTIGDRLLGHDTWEQQQAWSEKQTAEYLQKYSHARSDRYVFKEIILPNGKAIDLDLRIERPKIGGPFPVVFFVHGGGWITGTKAGFGHQSFELTNRGVAGVRVEYRWKSQGGNFSNVIGDVLDAIEYVRRRREDLNLDFSRVGLAGDSAGAHLSAIAAQITPECICYDGFNGLYDLTNPGTSRFAGGDDFTGTSEAHKRRASAIYQIKADPPDTFLYHGTEDTVIDVNQSRLFAKRIQEHGGEASVLVYEGVEHTFFTSEPYLSKTTHAFLDHVCHVFGIDDKKPELSNYYVVPKVAKHCTGFAIIGKWHQADKPHTSLEFKSDRSATYTTGEKIRWEERYGNYYVVWNWHEGAHELIEIIEPNKVRIGTGIFVRSATPATIVPASTKHVNEQWLSDRHKQIHDELKDNNELPDIDLIFVGDSITQGWLTEGQEFWKESFTAKPWKALNLGVAGDRTENVLQRLQSHADGGLGNLNDPKIKPKVVVLMIGTNNLWDNKPDDIVSGVLACKTRLQELEPQARIVICSVLPVSDIKINNSVVIPLNTALQKMHSPPEVRWLNLYPHFTDNSGTPRKNLYRDGVHLTPGGYKIWHNELVSLFSNRSLSNLTDNSFVESEIVRAMEKDNLD